MLHAFIYDIVGYNNFVMLYVGIGFPLLWSIDYYFFGRKP